MFNEILRIKPVLDEATSKQMETSLSKRFTSVATRFGSGLRAVIKGSVLGISLALLNKLLNPIEALDEKIKNLLGVGTDIKDLADKFGTSGGKLKQAQDVAQSLGLSPDQFRETLTKYSDAVDKAREELANPLQEKSAATVAIGSLASQSDKLESFKQFLTILRDTGKGGGRDQPISARASRLFNEAAQPGGQPISEAVRQELLKNGEIKRFTGPQFQQFLEKEVLGAQQFGAGKRLVNADFTQQAKTINEPAVGKLDEAVNKLSDLDARKRVLDVQAQTTDFLNASQKINKNFVDALAKSDAREEAEKTSRLESYESAKRGADAIEDVKESVNSLVGLTTSIFGSLKSITQFLPGVKSSRGWNGILSNKKE